MADPRDTPAMRQYFSFKRQHPDCLLLFRIGDFYETFDDDAVKLSKAAGLTLTQRTEGVPMAGMPFHQLDNYLRRLIDQGIRVAVCDQIEDPAQAKARGGAGAIIQRAVTRVLTPGTLVDESLLAPDAQAALAAVCFPDGGEQPETRACCAVVDLSTGRFVLVDATAATLADELVRRQVSELVYSAPPTGDSQPPPRVRGVLNTLGLSGTPQPAWYFRQDESAEILKKLYGVVSLEGFGLREDDPALPAAGAILRYLQTTQLAGSSEDGGPSEIFTQPQTNFRISQQAESKDVVGRIGRDQDAGKRRNYAGALAHLQPPRREDPKGFCILDATSLRSLEVLATMRAAAAGRTNGTGINTDGSLVGIFAAASGRSFSGCRTAMGKRLLRDWLCQPLCDLGKINARQTCVQTFVSDRKASQELGNVLGEIQDVARIASRVALGRATPRDLVGLGNSLGLADKIAALLENSTAFTRIRSLIDSTCATLHTFAEEVLRVCVDAPPGHLREGGLVRDGVDAELDEARLLQRDAAGWMAQYQAKLISDHDLPSLKVGYNKIFGYYIELPAGQAKRAPEIFRRKQTLKNAERYITPELHEFEVKVSTAQSRAISREQAIFEQLCLSASALLREINAFGDAVAELDVLLCFADKAFTRGWIKPEMVEDNTLEIVQGRHPVLDELLDSTFVPNDVVLGSGAGSDMSEAASTARLALITGPNMAGKSTFIRQTALLTLMAHAGSFIPAQSARIGLTDRIFTRVGADDALHAGQSTFMVEMTETARILNHATAKSLVILDEIGRGTSTLDGLSLAWAIAEHLASEHGPRTLFATHYHELTDLEEMMPGRVQNLHVSVKEWGDEIVFLHRILPGRTDQSYGIHVAKIAGLPNSAVARAKQVLESLAVHHGLGTSSETHTPKSAGADSKGLIQAKNGRDSTNSLAGRQMGLFTEYLQHPALDALREIKIETLSPMQAFDLLRSLSAQAAMTRKHP